MSGWGPVLRCGLGGIALGLATLTAFSFIGVPTIPVAPAEPAQPATAAPQTQPAPPATAPPQALLTAADLPPGFAPVPPLAVVGTGCAVLLADPAAGRAGAVEEDRGQPATGAHLWEAVALAAGDTLATLRDHLAACGDFRFQQGHASVRRLPDPVPDGFAFAVAVRSPAGSRTGYLAGARAGALVCVLRYLGPASGPDALTVILRTALDRIVSVTGPPQR